MGPLSSRGGEGLTGRATKKITYFAASLTKMDWFDAQAMRGNDL